MEINENTLNNICRYLVLFETVGETSTHQKWLILICSWITLTFSHRHRYDDGTFFYYFFPHFLVSHADHPTNQRCIGNKNSLYVIIDMKLAVGEMLKIQNQ